MEFALKTRQEVSIKQLSQIAEVDSREVAEEELIIQRREQKKAEILQRNRDAWDEEHEGSKQI